MTGSDKQSLRAAALKARQQIGAEEAQVAARLLAEHMLRAIPKSVETIAGYLAVRGEIDVVETLTQLHMRGHRLCLPVIVKPDAPLLFRHWHPGGALEKGMYDIEIPLATERPMIPDVVITPLAAFDAAGHRLGYGMGFYDRTISRLRESKKDVQIIGAAYGAQQVANIPHETHDEKLNAVVTEKGIIQFS